jgi:hypothetical protein
MTARNGNSMQKATADQIAIVNANIFIALPCMAFPFAEITMMTIRSLAAVAVAMCAMVTVTNAFLDLEFAACTSACVLATTMDEGCSWASNDDGWSPSDDIDYTECDACYSACGSGTMVQASAAIFATFAAVATMM